MDTKLAGQIGIFVALLVSLGIIAYQTVTTGQQDVFFVSLVTLILGKYVQQVAAQQGAESINTTTHTVAAGVIQGINGSAAAQLKATQDNTAALISNAAAAGLTSSQS